MRFDDAWAQAKGEVARSGAKLKWLDRQLITLALTHEIRRQARIKASCRLVCILHAMQGYTECDCWCTCNPLISLEGQTLHAQECPSFHTFIDRQLVR